MNLSDALRRFRSKMNITQQEMAAIAEISYRNYQDYEYGRVIPTVTVLISIADYFNVSLDYLVGRSNTTYY